MVYDFYKQADILSGLLNTAPEKAIQVAKQIDSEDVNYIALRAATLVDGGELVRNLEAVTEGVELYRSLLKNHSVVQIKYNLANGLVALIGRFNNDSDWLAFMETNRLQRKEARQLYWEVANSTDSDVILKTQAWTNLANQLSSSFRMSEAHDSRLSALKTDSKNGVAAASASKDLLWLYHLGGCSEVTLTEAAMLAKIACDNSDKVEQYAGKQYAEELLKFARQFQEVPVRNQSDDAFLKWVESDRLTLSPVVELVDPTYGSIDWLVLPSITSELNVRYSVPPIFAMFNTLKSDFILARDLVWRVISDSPFPNTGRYSDTLDYALYGPEISALTSAHKIALDILDKVAIAANHYFNFGESAENISFSNLWRVKDKNTKEYILKPLIYDVISKKAPALYGLVELADDFRDPKDIRYTHKDIRNFSTHRFIVLHDLGSYTVPDQQSEIGHFDKSDFERKVISALQVCRASIQLLAFAIRQNEQYLKSHRDGLYMTMDVLNHEYIRGRDN